MNATHRAVLARLAACLTPPFVLDLETVGDALLMHEIQLTDLPAPLAYICVADGAGAHATPIAFERAVAEDAALRSRLEEAEAAADRYYREMCRRTPPSVRPIVPEELWRARGDLDRAALIEADRRAWYGGAA